MMDFLSSPLTALQSFSEAQRLLKEGSGPVQLSGCVESQKVQMMSQAGQTKTRLVVTYDEREARAIREDFGLFSSCALLFPEKDLLFYQADTKSNVLVRERMRVLRALYEARCDETKEVVVVTTMGGAMNALVPFEHFEKRLILLEEGAVVEMNALAARLISLGYERAAKVEAPGRSAWTFLIMRSIRSAPLIRKPSFQKTAWRRSPSSRRQNCFRIRKNCWTGGTRSGRTQKRTCSFSGTMTTSRAELHCSRISGIWKMTCRRKIPAAF